MGGEIFPSVAEPAGAALLAGEEGRTSRAPESCAAGVLIAAAGAADGLEAILAGTTFADAETGGCRGRCFGAAAGASAGFAMTAEPIAALLAVAVVTLLAERSTESLAADFAGCFAVAPLVADRRPFPTAFLAADF